MQTSHHFVRWGNGGERVHESELVVSNPTLEHFVFQVKSTDPEAIDVTPTYGTFSIQPNAISVLPVVIFVGKVLCQQVSKLLFE